MEIVQLALDALALGALGVLLWRTRGPLRLRRGQPTTDLKTIEGTVRSVFRQARSNVEGLLEQTSQLNVEVRRLHEELETAKIERARKDEEFKHHQREVEHKANLEPPQPDVQGRFSTSLYGRHVDVTLYQGDSGARARQVYENHTPKAGERIAFFEGSVCRSVKHG